MLVHNPSAVKMYSNVNATRDLKVSLSLIYFRLINSTNYTIMKCISRQEMLVFGLVCDVALLGVICCCCCRCRYRIRSTPGTSHVRREENTVCRGSLLTNCLVWRAAQEVFRSATCAVLLQTHVSGSSAGMEVLWTEKNTRFLAKTQFCS